MFKRILGAIFLIITLMTFIATSTKATIYTMLPLPFIEAGEVSGGMTQIIKVFTLPMLSLLCMALVWTTHSNIIYVPYFVFVGILSGANIEKIQDPLPTFQETVGLLSAPTTDELRQFQSNN